MKKILRLFVPFILLITYLSCSKHEPAAPADKCAGITIAVNAAATNATGTQQDGAITATATGSSGITFSLNGGSAQNSGTFANLAAGTYTVLAKNANGCSGSAQVVVGTANPCAGGNVVVTGTVTNATITNNDGSITVNAVGGTGFTYSINGGTFQAGNIFSALAAGSYSIIAKNSTGCIGNGQFTITNPCTGIIISVTAVITNTPTGQTIGSINASATGGSGFTFSLNSATFQGSGLFSNLGVGIYTITAKNSTGCTGSAQFSVAASNICTGVTITVTSTTTATSPCVSPANGGIAISATGGVTPYMYNLNGGAFQTANTFTSLSANTYSIIVRDVNGCTQTASAIVATAVPGPLFTAVKQVMTANCALSGCHAGASPQNGLDFNNNCTIVANNLRIKARAVDANPSVMPPIPNPPLSATDKQKIVNWVNAGGRLTD